MLTHGSLFSGIEGFGAGFDAAGIETVWHVEIDPDCQKVLRHHCPGALILGDVCECGAHNLPPVDIITFGSPCQDLSLAGKRKGLAGERSGLFFEAVRIIRELRPALAVWENVPGALSSSGGRDFGAILDALAESGALDIGWRILDAQWFGVPQRRRRVFVIADFRARRACEILSIPEGRRGDPAPSRETGARVAATITERTAGASNQWAPRNEADNLIAGTLGSVRKGAGWNDDLDRAGAFIAFGGNNIADAIDVATACNAKGGTGRIDFESETFVCGALGTAQGGADDNDAQGGRMVVSFDRTRSTVSGDIAAPLRVNGGQAPGVNNGKADNQCVLIFESRFARNGRGAPSEIVPPLKAQSGQTGKGDGAPLIAFTERTRAGGRSLESQEDLAYALTNPGAGGRAQERNIAGAFGVRRLLPVEAARLQGFSDDWLDGMGLSDSAKYRMLGNAVAVPCAAWIGKRIVAALASTTGDASD